MARRGIFWFKTELAMTEDERIQDLVDEWGAEGFGVWFSCLFQIYRHGNEDATALDRDKMVRRVAKHLNMAQADVLTICEWMADAGLFNKEVWERGRVANEYAAGAICDYWEKVRNGQKGGRPPKKPQVKTTGAV